MLFLYLFQCHFKQEDVSVQLEALDILSDLLCRFGSEFVANLLINLIS